MLEVHRAERADVLAAALCAQLSEGSGDPFEAEIIAVPSRGVERWLTQQLSLVLGARGGGSDGVCANVEFPGPGRLTADVVAAAGALPGGVAAADPHTDPWRPGRSVWPLLELICAEPELLGRAPHVTPGVGRSGHYEAARRVAALFDAYATARPAMIRDWIAGSDTDGHGEPLGAQQLWQPQLWRRLRSLLGVPSPVERLAPACARLIDDPAVAELPSRLSLFGLTRLPPGQLEVLAALAVHRDVHLWLLHPSTVLWERVRALAPAGPVRRAADPTAEAARHPLLASLARDARELQLTVASAPLPATDVHHPSPEAPPATVLQALQQALRTDAPAAAPFPLGADDGSVQVHACHGRARQVEVLRDVILGLLADDPGLEPRDVLVMCPDIETFAPLISATFGADAGVTAADGVLEVPVSPAAQLRVRLADRSLRQVNPVMGVAAAVLEMADGRMTASEVLDLAAAAPVRRRFGFDDDDLARLADWVDEAEVKWGLDPSHRGAYRLERYQQNTWEAGLDRLLLGVTMAEYAAGGSAMSQPGGPGWVGLALPLDDVDSTDIERVGLLAELVHRLRVARERLAGPQSLGAWIEALSQVVESLTACAPAQAWQSAQLRGELASVLEGAGERAATVELTLADLRHLLADRLQGRPTRANFRTGSLTMCTLVPMRSVPHRVVCLLGLDDGAFPRASGTGGSAAVDVDDVLRRAPVTGEREGRSEDRQLFLDAISSARDHLVVIYAGADERTNARRPPAVPVGELLDAVDAMTVTATGRPASEQIVVRHPLQPFDPSNYRAPAGGRPFSFDRASMGGARAVLEPRRSPAPFLTGPLTPADADDVELDTLRRFFEGPVRGFLRQRLEMTLPERADDVSDELVVELDSLARWGVGDRMLRSRLSGVSAATCRQAEWRRGTLPPGRLGTRELDDIAGDVEAIVAQASAARVGEPAAYDLGVELPGGRRLTGTVGGVHGQRLVTVDYGKINPKRRLRLWLPYLLLAAARPDLQVTGLAIGRASFCEVGPIGVGEARAWLADLLDLHAAGLREPLPLALDTSLAYATARRRGAPVEEAMRRAASCWATGDYAESRSPEHVAVFGADAGLDVLAAAAPGPDDEPEQWPEEPSRFGLLSRRWWDPLLEAESRVGG